MKDDDMVVNKKKEICVFCFIYVFSLRLLFPHYSAVHQTNGNKVKLMKMVVLNSTLVAKEIPKTCLFCKHRSWKMS